MERPATSESMSPSGRGRLVKFAGVVSVGTALALIGLKLWAWSGTGSVAVLSSLTDSVLDLFASLITLLAVRFALEPADREHRFGHGKLEALAGLAQAQVITISAIYVAIQAVSRLLEPRPIEAPIVGVGVMLASIVITLLLVAFQRSVVRRTGSIAIAADAQHYQADVLTNLAVLAAIAADALLAWRFADPVLGLVVVVLILANVWSLVVKSFDVLLDRELPSARRREIEAIANAHRAVKGVHDLRTRSSGNADFIQFHLELDPRLSLDEAHEITDAVEASVKERFPDAEVIIHADPEGLDEVRDSY